MIKKILLAILLVIILLFAFIVFCISSQAGLKTTIWLAKTCLPGKLTVFEARGRLMSRSIVWCIDITTRMFG